MLAQLEEFTGSFPIVVASSVFGISQAPIGFLRMSPLLPCKRPPETLSLSKGEVLNTPERGVCLCVSKLLSSTRQLNPNRPVESLG